MELSTRNVIATDWTGLRIGISVLEDMMRAEMRTRPNLRSGRTGARRLYSNLGAELDFHCAPSSQSRCSSISNRNLHCCRPGDTAFELESESVG